MVRAPRHYRVAMTESTQTVEVSDPGRSSILTLMIGQILAKNLLDPSKQALIRGKTFTTVIRAGRMTTSLVVDRGAIRVLEGRQGNADLELSGSIRTLLGLAVGESLLKALLRRELSFRVFALKGLLCGIYLTGLLRHTPLPAFLKWCRG